MLPNFGIAGGTTFGVCAQVMLAHASDDFKRRHLPRMLAGDELWCQFFSEPVAGSDLAGVQTRATRDGDTWVLNGAKVWSSWAHLADYGLCLARTNWSVPKHRGLTWFGVPVDAPGVDLRVIRQINGGADFCEEFFDDVVIPDDERIGDVDQGWTVARTMLVFERGGSAVARLRRHRSSRGRSRPTWSRSPRRPAAPTTRRHASSSPEAHSLDFLRQVLDRRLAIGMKQSGADAGVAAYGELAHGIFDAERALIGMELARGDAIAWDEAGGHGRVDRAHVPQRPDQLDRRRHRPDAAQRHQRAGARSAARAELGPRQAVRPGAARRAALGRPRLSTATEEGRAHESVPVARGRESRARGSTCCR